MDKEYLNVYKDGSMIITQIRNINPGVIWQNDISKGITSVISLKYVEFIENRYAVYRSICYCNSINIYNENEYYIEDIKTGKVYLLSNKELYDKWVRDNYDTSNILKLATDIILVIVNEKEIIKDILKI